jgi:hypothetical protein
VRKRFTLLDRDSNAQAILPHRLERLETEPERQQVGINVARDRRLYEGLQADLACDLARRARTDSAPKPADEKSSRSKPP